jgi:hypothetical protein
MASFTTKTFAVHDDYMTPASAWQNIAHLLPKDKVLWEPFYGDGASGRNLREATGCEVVHEPEDFFTYEAGDVVVTNPPFSKKKEVFTRLKELGKPFVVVCPASMLTTQYFRQLFSGENIQIIIPRKRIQFGKMTDGCVTWEGKCNFDCFYYCWKMDLPNDISWLETDVSARGTKRKRSNPRTEERPLIPPTEVPSLVIIVQAVGERAEQHAQLVEHDRVGGGGHCS